MKNKITAFFPFFILFPLFSLTACKSSVDYTNYVSEYRSEIYRAEQDGYSLTACFSFREYPYKADGVCKARQEIMEVSLTAPDNTADYTISFSLNGQEYGGDMSYDSVYSRFFYSRSAPSINLSSLDFTVRSEEEEIVLTAVSVKSGNELPMPELISRLAEQKAEYFSEKTEGKIFNGEIYVRMLCDGEVCFYVEISTESGTDACFLLDAVTGEILAERTVTK